MLVPTTGCTVLSVLTTVSPFYHCGEVEDVISVLTLVRRGVAQVFHVLLVELRVQLVVEVEEEGKEDAQEEGEEVKGGSQVEERTTTWMTMVME